MFFCVKKWDVGNRLKRVLAKFDANRSYVWGVNGCSKFRTNFRNRKFSYYKFEFAVVRPANYCLGREIEAGHEIGGVFVSPQTCLRVLFFHAEVFRKCSIHHSLFDVTFCSTLKWSKTGEDSSDFDDSWTVWIVMTRSIVWDTLCFFTFFFCSYAVFRSWRGSVSQFSVVPFRNSN